MAAADINVRRLRLGPRLAAPTVEDALRVSTKPAALLNRVVFVRRLRLRAAAGASAQALALQLERAWQQLAARAEPLEQAGSAAEAVWAPSAAAARQALLRRWLRGEPTDAWFWQKVAPPLPAQAWPARALALMLLADDATAGPTAVSRARQQAGQVRALLALIAEHRAAAQFVDATTEAEALAVLELIDMPQDKPWRAPRRHHGEPQPSRAMTARARLFEAMAALSPGIAAKPAERHAAPPALARTAPVAAPAMDLAGSPPAAHRLPDAGADTPLPETAAPTLAALPVEPPAAGPGHGLASGWAGLWLLLPVLSRHGLDDADDPLAAWAGAMQAACRRFRIPADDPIHAALAALGLPAAESPPWLRTARLAAAHDARLPLLRIARRHGTAWISPERIDIEFPPAALDLRIRRAGFDIDPGFVPWLDRIVHFHYPS